MFIKPLEPAGEVYVIADDRIIKACLAPHVSHQRFAGMDSKTGRKYRVPSVLGPKLQLMQTVPAPDRCLAGRESVSGVWQGRVPESHDRIAHVLVDCAARIMDLFAENGKMFAQQFNQSLRGHTFGDGSKIRNVGKTNRDHPPFAAQTRLEPGGEERADQIRGHVFLKGAQTGFHLLRGGGQAMNFLDVAAHGRSAFEPETADRFSFPGKFLEGTRDLGRNTNAYQDGNQQAA